MPSRPQAVKVNITRDRSLGYNACMYEVTRTAAIQLCGGLSQKPVISAKT